MKEIDIKILSRNMNKNTISFKLDINGNGYFISFGLVGFKSIELITNSYVISKAREEYLKLNHENNNN